MSKLILSICKQATFLFIFILPCLTSCSEQTFNKHKDEQKVKSHTIIQTPIINNYDRRKLSIQFLKEHHSIEVKKPKIVPKMIVIHRSNCDDYQTVFDSFNSTSSEANEQELNFSAHYLVDKDGTIYQLLPNTEFSRHVKGLNHSAIGIENIGDKSNGKLTTAQIDANTLLIKMLASEYPIEYVIGHYEYSQFVYHPLWQEQEDVVVNVVPDPGAENMANIRARLAELDLKPVPTKSDTIIDALIKKII